MPLLCTRCGAHNSEGHEACAVCGNPLAGAPLVQAPGQAVPYGVGAASGAGRATPVPPVPGRQQAVPGARQAAPATGPQHAAPGSPPEVTGAPPEEQVAAADVSTGDLQAGERPVPDVPAQAPAGLEADAGSGAPSAPCPGQQLTGQYPLPPAAFPGFGYPVQMPYGYPAWQEGQGYVPPFGYPCPPMSPFGGFGFVPPYGFMPPMPWPGPYPQYGMPYYLQAQPPVYPGTYGVQAPYPAPYPGLFAPRKQRMKAVYIILIIIGVLVLIGGAVTAAILLTGNGKAAFKLGDGSVTGADVEFRDLELKQEGSTLTLTGKYDNNTKKEGKVYLTVEAVSNGSEQLLNFTVPVTPGKGHSVSQKKTESLKLSQATLGALIFQGSYSSDDNGTGSDAYPWDTSPDDGSTTPYPDESTAPYKLPYTTPRSGSVPSTLD